MEITWKKMFVNNFKCSRLKKVKNNLNPYEEEMSIDKISFGININRKIMKFSNVQRKLSIEHIEVNL